MKEYGKKINNFMKLKNIISELQLITVVEANLDKDIFDAYACDLLSDVMGNAQEGQIWITMQTHKNLAAIASLKDLPAIIIVGNNKPAADLVEFAKENNVAIFTTSMTAFKTCGLLWNIFNK